MADEPESTPTPEVSDPVRRRPGRPRKEEVPQVSEEPSEYIIRAELVAWLRQAASLGVGSYSNKGLPPAYLALATRLEKGEVP